MTPTQIRAIRKRIGLSPEQFAAALGFTAHNYKDYRVALEDGEAQAVGTNAPLDAGASRYENVKIAILEQP